MTDVVGQLAQHGLRVSGIVEPVADDNLPDWARAIVLVSPDEPMFWDVLTKSPEWRDDSGNSVDRWSTRILETLAAQNDGIALFPFGGAPYHPFYTWALRSGSACVSPVTLLADATAGLFVSYRGALALPFAPDVTLPPPPCDACKAKPCREACPASALTANGYDVPKCRSYLETVSGADCLERGCQTRRACPAGRKRPTAQSAYFMSQFHK